MLWVKLWVSLRKNPKFKRLSSDAKVAFVCGLMTAADYDTGGAISLQDGPLTAKEMANDELLVPEKRLSLVLSELQNAGLFTIDAQGIPHVNRFDEKAGEQSKNESNAERQARSRARKRQELESLRESVTALEEALRNAVTSQRYVTKRDVTKKVTDVEVEVDTPTTSVDKSTSVVGTTRVEDDTSWVTPLKVAAQALARMLLSQLDAEQRFTLGRYHAFRFGNCTVNERKNRRAGTKVAAGIGGLAADFRYGQITVQQYVNFAAKVHEQREAAPWFDPWLIKAVVEFEQC